MAETPTSQNLYEDSDLAPITSLFREMGNDRSFLAKVGGVFEDAAGITAESLFGWTRSRLQKFF